jgi:hypothetical protein
MDTKQPIKKMYISLPMTGIDDNNSSVERIAFHIARSLGYWVYTPSHLAEFVKETLPNPEYKHFLGFDIWSISRCHAVMLCPGWEKSKGCLLEVRFAIENDIPIYDFDTREIISNDKIERGLFPEKFKYEIEKLENTSSYENLIFWFVALGLCFLAITGVIHWIQKMF